MNPLSLSVIREVLNHPQLELSRLQILEEPLRRIQQFCALAEKWNDKINLTSEKSARSILEKHVFDSLLYLPWVDFTDSVLDIGSGAGFPGLPLKIICPQMNLTLIESQRKRCNFLREAVRTLNLEKIRVLEGRAESLSSHETLAASFDRVLFRGFGSLETCLSAGLPFLKNGGRIILKKSPEEMPEPASQALGNARIIDTRTVEGFAGKTSLMMVIEKCST